MKSNTQVFRCQVCLAEHDGGLPIQVAFRLLSVPDQSQQEVMQMLVPGDSVMYDEETWFDRGWSTGVDQGGPVNPTPFQGDGEDEVGMVAWLVGYVAGSYASLNGWATASCRLADPEDHLITNSLPLYMKEVETAGFFPVGCLGFNQFTRGLMQSCMDSGWPYQDAAESVKLLLANGKIKGLPIPSPETIWDPNPNVFRPDQPGAYAAFIKELDAHDPTWFWFEPMHLMAPEIRQVAVERRLRAVGEHGHQGTGQGPCKQSRTWGPWGLPGRQGN